MNYLKKVLKKHSFYDIEQLIQYTDLYKFNGMLLVLYMMVTPGTFANDSC